MFQIAHLMIIFCIDLQKPLGLWLTKEINAQRFPRGGGGLLERECPMCRLVFNCWWQWGSRLGHFNQTWLSTVQIVNGFGTLRIQEAAIFLKDKRPGRDWHQTLNKTPSDFDSFDVSFYCVTINIAVVKLNAGPDSPNSISFFLLCRNSTQLGLAGNGHNDVGGEKCTEREGEREQMR